MPDCRVADVALGRRRGDLRIPAQELRAHLAVAGAEKSHGTPQPMSRVALISPPTALASATKTFVPYGCVTRYVTPGTSPVTRTRTRPKAICSPSMGSSAANAASWARTSRASTPLAVVTPASAAHQKASSWKLLSSGVAPTEAG